MITAFLNSLRPRQWTKNFLVFAALFFIPGALLVPNLIFRSVGAFILFTLAVGAGYLINDIRDIEYDRNHPRKRKRPIASGKLPIPVAITGALVLIVLALAGGYWLDITTPQLTESATPLNEYSFLPFHFPFLSTVTFYLLLMVVYSTWIRHVAMLDVLFLSVGFVLRAVAGAVALKVEISPWLLLCTGLLALYLALAKRRQELVRLKVNGEDNGDAPVRKSLAGYTIPLLDQLLIMAAALNVMSYSLYTFWTTGHPDNRLMLTIPFVIYGIFRYHFLIHNEDAGEAPDEVLLKDKPLLICIFLWAAFVTVLLLLPGEG